MIVETDTRDGVLCITLNRPEALNAFTEELHSELAAALEQAGDASIGAVVITGAGRGFCVGQDLNEAQQHQGRGIAELLRSSYHPNVLAIRRLEKPVLAAINGPCAGAGLSLATACDIRVASEQASFTPAFVNIGLVPDSGGSYFLVRLLGYARAFEWLASGNKITAHEAREAGLVSRVVSRDRLMEDALKSASSLAAMPGDAVGMTKRLLDHALSATLEQQLEIEAGLQARAASQPVLGEKIDAFLNRQRA